MHTNQVHLFWCVNKAEEAVYVNELQEISNNYPNFKYTNLVIRRIRIFDCRKTWGRTTTKTKDI